MVNLILTLQQNTLSQQTCQEMLAELTDNIWLFL